MLTGSVIAILLICYHMFSMPAIARQEMLWSIVGITIFFGLFLGGVVSGFIVENYFIHKLTNQGSIIGCIIGSILISPLSVYIAIIFGAYGGGGLGDIIGDKIGMNKFGFLIGMFIGSMLTVIIVESIGAAIGTYLGIFGNKLMQKQGGGSGHGIE